MALDGFFIKKLILETNKDIIGGRLEKITQIESDIFVFSFYLRKKRSYLYFKLNSPNGSFYLLDNLNALNNLQSNLLTSLKQHIEGYILVSINQHKNDRVVTFTFEGNDFLDGKVTKHVVVELMGRHNNLILLKDNNEIVDAYHKKFDPNNRSILPKNTYEFFPTEKIDFDYNYEKSDSPLYYSKNFIGFSPLLSKYLFNNQIDINTINVNPTKNLENGHFYWFNLFNKDDDIKSYDSLSLLLSDSITIKQKSNNKYINFISKEILKNNKLLGNLLLSLDESKANLNLKDKANLIYSSGLNLNSNYSSFTDYNNETHELDSKISLNDNAQKYYKLYQKAKRSIDHINRQIEDTKNNLELLNQFEYDLNSLDANYLEIEENLVSYGFKIKKQKVVKKQHKKITPLKLEYNDATFYVGKNNLQNEYVTHEVAKHNDYWFHIKDAPGSHVILKGELNDKNLEFAAMLAAKYSKEALNPVISVNYTLIKNVKKIPGTKGYNVLLKEFKTINIKVDNDLINQIFIANHL